MKSYINKFDFKIGTTSYIIHSKKNNLLKNVGFLKNKFDLIQLLFFGKNFLDGCLNDKTIAELKSAKDDSGTSYAVHLPLDLGLLDDDKKNLSSSFDAMEKIFDKTSSLDIKQYILHIDRKERKINFDKKEYETIENILSKINKMISPEMVLIENTHYDISYFSKPIIKNNFSVCLDIPHAFIYKYDFKNIHNTFEDRIKMLHVYGFKKGDNHESLSVLNKNILEDILKYLKNFKNNIIIEVFSKNDLNKSMKILEKNSGKTKEE